MPSGKSSVKCFEQSCGLDTELHNNLPFYLLLNLIEMSVGRFHWQSLIVRVLQREQPGVLLTDADVINSSALWCVEMVEPDSATLIA